MSQENVRLVERAIAAINARDIEGYLACCTENVKLETPMAAVGGVYEGIDGIRRYFTDIEEAAPDFRIELDGVEEVDSKRAIAFLRISSTGRTSGIRMAPHLTNVYDLIDGKISHVRIFLDRQEALKAVGLGGQAISQQNVEIVRSVMDLARRARESGVNPEPTDLVAPDAEIDMSRRVFNPDTYHRMEGWRRLTDEIREVWEEFRTTPKRFIDAGDQVVVIETIRVRGRGSGVELESRPSATIWTLRDGRVTRVQIGLDPREALKAVGVAELDD